MRFGPVRALVALILVTLPLAPARAAEAPDPRAFFEDFVAAQNAHDAEKVRSMLWDGPQMLWITRGIQIRGADAVTARFREYYQATWQLDPDMSKFEATALGDGVAQVLVPITFTRGNPGQPPQQARILISQTYVRVGAEWRVASILAVADTQLK